MSITNREACKNEKGSDKKRISIFYYLSLALRSIGGLFSLSFLPTLCSPHACPNVIEAATLYELPPRFRMVYLLVRRLGKRYAILFIDVFSILRYRSVRYRYPWQVGSGRHCPLGSLLLHRRCYILLRGCRWGSQLRDRCSISSCRC